MRERLLIDVAVGETLHVSVPGDKGAHNVSVTVEKKSGQVARLRIVAHEAVEIRTPPKRQRVAVPG